MKVLVLGGDGQVGRAVADSAPAHVEVVSSTRRELDISDQQQVASRIARAGAAWVVNGAAYTAVDRAEDEPELARLSNDTAVGHIAEATASTGGRLLHFSTDFVFDGTSNRPYTPADATGPLSVYGATKLAGEKSALARAPDAVVLRTSWVHAARGKNFALTMLKLMRERPEVRVVADQIGTPTWAGSIARCAWAIMERGIAGGTYHWTDAGVASWFDFAVAVRDEALSRDLLNREVAVQPISTSDFPTRAKRPAFSVLDSSDTRRLVGFQADYWRHNLGKMLDELCAA
jgi:dTDP-4-dehydrorhamnose reductase